MPTKNRTPRGGKNASNDNRTMKSGSVDFNKALAAVAAYGWMHAAATSGPTVSSHELSSLSALIAYVAHRSGESERRVAQRLLNHFGVAQVEDLPAEQFDTALRFLVDAMVH